MTEAQQKAWDILTKTEQESLYFQLTQGKSSWEVGEMMKLPHYKYLEYRDRAQKFFKMFAEFFEKYPSLFRPNNPLVEETFRDYIFGALEKRLTRKEASKFAGDASMILKNVSSANITRNMKRLKESPEPWDRDLWDLIMEFDRWNNFRILPKLLQQPSAFRRRVNKKYKVYLRYTLDRIPLWLLPRLKEKFYYKTRPNKPKYWVVLISDVLYPDDGYYIFPIRPQDEVVEEMSKRYIYVWPTREVAEDFAFLASRFRVKTTTVKLGLGFWPVFLDTIQKAVNYNAVNNLRFNTKDLDNYYMEHGNKKQRANRISKQREKLGLSKN